MTGDALKGTPSSGLFSCLPKDLLVASFQNLNFFKLVSNVFRVIALQPVFYVQGWISPCGASTWMFPFNLIANHFPKYQSVYRLIVVVVVLFLYLNILPLFLPIIIIVTHFFRAKLPPLSGPCRPPRFSRRLSSRFSQSSSLMFMSCLIRLPSWDKQILLLHGTMFLHFLFAHRSAFFFAFYSV